MLLVVLFLPLLWFISSVLLHYEEEYAVWPSGFTKFLNKLRRFSKCASFIQLTAQAILLWWVIYA